MLRVLRTEMCPTHATTSKKTDNREALPSRGHKAANVAMAPDHELGLMTAHHVAHVQIKAHRELRSIRAQKVRMCFLRKSASIYQMYLVFFAIGGIASASGGCFEGHSCL